MEQNGDAETFYAFECVKCKQTSRLDTKEPLFFLFRFTFKLQTLNLKGFFGHKQPFQCIKDIDAQKGTFYIQSRGEPLYFPSLPICRPTIYTF